MSAALLVVNAGSSSIKFRLFADSDGLPLLAEGRVTGLPGTPEFRLNIEDGESWTESWAGETAHDAAFSAVLEKLEAHCGKYRLAGAGHRVVHGGEAYTAPVRVDTQVLSRLERLSPLAPLHQPHNLAAIRILEALRPGLPQIACFDTAFHCGHEPVFDLYALPKYLRQAGIRRYGFHGLSYEWIAECLKADHPGLAGGRVVAAHLGNGASLCAIREGRSVDTTMGFTALDGLPMGTRCGALDPGAVIYMIREMGMSADEADRALSRESGLLGLSGISNDVRDLEASDAPDAALALEYFALRAAQNIAAMTVSLGGPGRLDGLVFSGGIGENAHALRERIVARLGLSPDIPVLVIPANEERMIAMHMRTLL